MRRRPGLLRLATRTAVVAGTVTVVIDGVHLRRVRRVATIEDTRISQLERLARLRAQGDLSEAEFDSEKAAVLGTPRPIRRSWQH